MAEVEEIQNGGMLSQWALLEVQVFCAGKIATTES